MLKMFRTKKKGFTLVELMIVVAIIGILAAIAIPAFLRYIKSSKAAEAEQTLKKMTEGAKSYFSSEQRISASTNGDQPWHASTLGTPGLPVDWSLYVFPGGAGFTFCSTAATSGAVCGAATIPAGGSKKVPGAWISTPSPTEKAALNKLRVGFEDPTYFGYDYQSVGAAIASTATMRALADFNAGGNIHTVTTILTVDSSTQDVQTAPAFLQNEFE